MALVACVALVVGCRESRDSFTPPPASDFVFMLRPGATTWFIGVDGEGAGLDYDLAQLFAQRRGVPIKVVPASTPAQLVEAARTGRARIGGGGLIQPLAQATSSPPPGERPARNAAARAARPVSPLYSTGYYTVEPVLVYNVDAYKPESWRDLVGETVAVVAGTGLEASVESVRAQHPEVKFEVQPLSGDEALLGQVEEGSVRYALVASNEAAAARNVHLDVAVAFKAGAARELAWVLSPGDERLQREVDAFFKSIKRDGTLQRLLDRYFGYRDRVERANATAFHDRIRDVLPKHATAFRRAQDETGIDWRLLAAIAYQESRWDPLAISETNVRGMMMLTEETARRMQVSDRLDATQSIRAGARYVAELKRLLPARIGEPDRTWIALAGFNIGIAHLEDARVLAVKRKLSADSWSDLKRTLPLLAQPDIAAQTKYGFARGGQAVVFVETVRALYDVLLKLEKPHDRPTLRAGN